MKNLLFCLIISISLFNCKKDEVESEENELITTVKLKFASANTTQTFAWKDLDGDGGKAPIIEQISLKPNTTYTLSVEFSDESKTPPIDITSEIKKEQDEHLVIFTSSPTSLFTYTYSDSDSRNKPVGLVGNLKTGAIGTGTIKVQLRHQPPIGNLPSKDGTPKPGSDDINVDFNVEVK